MFIGGPSKARKTWTQIHLSISIATGRHHWGRPTTKGRVLYFNFELMDNEFWIRMNGIRKEMGLDDDEYAGASIKVYNMFGMPCDIETVTELILREARNGPISTVFLDPLYTIYASGDCDENNAADVSKFCQKLGSLARDTGALIVGTRHFAKGSAAGKNAIDRSAGSGVFERFAATVLNMSPQGESDDGLIVSLNLRYHEWIPDFCVSPVGSLMIVNHELSADKHKLPGASTPTLNEAEVSKAICYDGWCDMDRVIELVKDSIGPKVGVNRIKALVKEMVNAGTFDVSQRKNPVGKPTPTYRVKQAQVAKEQAPEAVFGASEPDLGDMN
jgi:hypothetical protein